MGFVKTKEEIDAYYKITARHFPGARMLGVSFQTRPSIAAKLVPPPLKADPMGMATAFIAEYPETNLGPGYREAALFIKCTFQGEQGNYCLSMPIDGQEVRLYNGREIFGYPKKAAKIHLEKNDNLVSGWVERHGIRFVEIKVTLASSLPALPPQGPNFLFKASPRIDLQPGFDGPVLLCRQQTDLSVVSLELGAAEVNLQHSEFDPWDELTVGNIFMGFYLVSNNTMQPGKVISEVPGESFLPYFFKMTDFAATP